MHLCSHLWPSCRAPGLNLRLPWVPWTPWSLSSAEGDPKGCAEGETVEFVTSLYSVQAAQPVLLAAQAHQGTASSCAARPAAKTDETYTAPGRRCKNTKGKMPATNLSLHLGKHGFKAGLEGALLVEPLSSENLVIQLSDKRRVLYTPA